MNTQTHPSHVPLSKLSIDEKVNVRKTGKGSEPMYVGSIEAKGIIEPLTVRLNGKGYTITNGGKRFASLKWMAEHGLTAGKDKVPVNDDYPVPINVRTEDDKEARDTSLMTNIVRAGMHPVDEFEAFAELRDGGMSEDEIAARYGLKVKEVRQRLALGRISPVIRTAWRAGDVTAEQAMAYTIAPSLKAQEQFFKKYGRDRWRGDAQGIREAFTVKHGDVGKLIAFVGVEALRKAGVKVDEDLFGADHRAADPKKVAEMAAEKLDAECARLLSEGWSWAIPATDPDAQGRRNWSTLDYRDKRPNAEEKQRLEELNKITDENDGFLEDMSPAEISAQDEIDAIEAAIERRAYKPAEKAKAGCIVSIGDRGALAVRYGLLKPAEVKAAKAVEKAKERKKKGLPAGPTYDISKAVTHDLTVTLTKAAAKAIVAQPDLALQLAVAGLMSCGYGGDTVLLKNDGTLSRSLARDVEFDEAFATSAKMTPAQRMAALAEQVGAAFSFTGEELSDLGGGAAMVCNAIEPKAMKAALLETFDAADYFNRVPAGHVVKAIEEAVGPEEARRVAKLKKAGVVAFAVDNVIGTGWLPPELRTLSYDGPGSKPFKEPKKPAKPAAKKRAKR